MHEKLLFWRLSRRHNEDKSDVQITRVPKNCALSANVSVRDYSIRTADFVHRQVYLSLTDIHFYGKNLQKLIFLNNVSIVSICND